MAKCAGGEGVFGWDNAGDDLCNRSTADGDAHGVIYVQYAASAAQIVKHINEVLLIKNPYNVSAMAGAVSGEVVGTMVVVCEAVEPGAAGGCTVQSYYDGDDTDAIAVPYM